MVLNVAVPEPLVRQLNGVPVVLKAPTEDLKNAVLGSVHLEEVEGVLTSGGLIVAFELEPAEVLAIKRGQKMFMIHFFNETMSPLRLLFERADFEFGTIGQEGESKEVNGTEFKFSEPGEEPKQN